MGDILLCQSRHLNCRLADQIHNGVNCDKKMIKEGQIRLNFYNKTVKYSIDAVIFCKLYYN